MWMRVVVLLLLASTGWAQEKSWDATVAAARKEGKVVVQGSPDPVMRKEIIPKFTARFGIPLEFLAGRSSEIAARVRIEQNAGVYSMDVFMSGPDTTATVLYAEKMIDPLKPLLSLPEVTDGGKWKTGKPWFIDPEGQYVLRLFSSVSDLFYVNGDQVKPEEMRSAQDLLNPKWRGKISSEDPTVTGRGSNQAARFYIDFGADYVKKLYLDQKVARSRNRRQLADWLARGTYPICLTCSDDDVAPLLKSGFKIVQIFELVDMKPPVNGSPFLLTLGKNAPHPNAARVYVNWLASKEGMETYSRGYGAVSLRTDVDHSFLDPRVVPKPGVKYFDDTEWKWVVTGRAENRDKVWEILKK